MTTSQNNAHSYSLRLGSLIIGKLLPTADLTIRDQNDPKNFTCISKNGNLQSSDFDKPLLKFSTNLHELYDESPKIRTFELTLEIQN